MQGFNFKLQKLLEIREDIEEKSKIDFKHAVEQCEKSQEKLENLKRNYTKYGSSRVTGSVVEQKQLYNYLNALSFSIDTANNEVDKNNYIVESKREELLKSQRDRKTVEILKEKQKQIFEKEIEVVEQKSNDEFALYGFLRNLKGGEK